MVGILNDSDKRKYRIQELAMETIAAELNLTFFAARHGKDSPVYRNSLRDFATAWYLLKSNRDQQEFHQDNHVAS